MAIFRPVLLLGFALLAALVFASGSALAAERAAETVVTQKDGSVDVTFPGVRQTYRLQASGDDLRCFVVHGRDLKELKNSTSSSRASGFGGNCKCGHECWEDEEMQASVCVCKACGGGGGGGVNAPTLRIVTETPGLPSN